MKNMAVGIDTVETTQLRFATTVPFMLFQAIVISHLEYSALFHFKISSFF